MENCPLNGKPCENAKSFHVTININGDKSEYKCCHECSALPFPESMVALPMALSNIIPQNILLQNLSKLASMEQLIDPLDQIRCENCGITPSEIRSNGRFGCPQCYETFKTQIKEQIPMMHAGGSTHMGKRPKTQNVDQLKDLMAKAVKEERYEDAAKYRDQIKELQKVL